MKPRAVREGADRPDRAPARDPARSPARHFDETADSVKASAAKAVGWWPLVAVAGGLAAGFAAAKYPRHAASRRPGVRYASVRAEAPPAFCAPRNVLATILGIAAMALRIGASKKLTRS